MKNQNRKQNPSFDSLDIEIIRRERKDLHRKIDKELEEIRELQERIKEIRRR